MKTKTILKLIKTAIPVLFLPLIASKVFALSITDINFSSLSGDVTEVRLDFDGQPPEITGYTIEKPARIAIDLPDTQSALTTKRHDIGMGNTRSATLVSAKDRSRLVINLTKAVGYTTKVSGNTLILRIGHNEAVQPVVSTASKAATPETAAPTASTLGARVVNRKSTRLNSSHVRISYAVFCLKKKKKKKTKTTSTIIKSKHNTNLITYC